MEHTVAVVEELKSVALPERGEGEQGTIRVFSLSLNGVTVELCSLGASITKFLVPSKDGSQCDDIVLGYASPLDMWVDRNPPFFGVVVGRVANRIAKGKLQMERNSPVYQLDTNFGPNHLHGGSVGFSHRIWDAEIVETAVPRKDGAPSTKAVRFSLLSKEGDQGYPGSVRVSATYSLCSTHTDNSVKLCLELEGNLLDGKTPVNLAQHSYFNLARHDNAEGILDHRLQMANCTAYTPVDDTLIPTREVRAVSKDAAMDWRQSRLLRVALADFGVTQMGLSRSQAVANTQKSRVLPDIGTASGPDGAESPYGFDHNYVVKHKDNEDYEKRLTKAAVVEHDKSGRRLTVLTNAPGIQFYSGNFLNGTEPSRERTKDAAQYKQWQSICLETQHFPDSILVDSTIHPDFARGACPILTANEPRYRHCVEYLLEYGLSIQARDKSTENKSEIDVPNFCGSDSEGRHYASITEMWQAQGITSGNRTKREAWYNRAASHYQENCLPTIDGVLGGFASLSDLDLAGSRQFVQDLQAMRPTFQWSSGAACECGAGIGRVSKQLSLPLGVTRSDLVESSSRFLNAAPGYLGDELASKCRFYCSGLQDWEPKSDSYSIIWIQWVLCYLTDDDAIAFLRKCGDALVKGGVIVLKENTCTDEDFVLDVTDSSVTRSVAYWKYLCTQAGLCVVYERMQDDFPDEIFPVPMIALEKV